MRLPDLKHKKWTIMIIFDIDETSLVTYPMVVPTLNFLWKEKKDIFQKTNVGLAIAPILELYRALKEKGFKIAFITGRSTSYFAITFAQLLNAGFNGFDYLLLKPSFLKDDGPWKFEQRESLSKNFNIVGCIGDQEADCANGFFGYKIILPNYLYRNG